MFNKVEIFGAARQHVYASYAMETIDVAEATEKAGILLPVVEKHLSRDPAHPDLKSLGARLVVPEVNLVLALPLQ